MAHRGGRKRIRKFWPMLSTHQSSAFKIVWYLISVSLVPVCVDGHIERMLDERPRILVLPFVMQDHVELFQPIVDELASRGYEMVTLLPAGFDVPRSFSEGPCKQVLRMNVTGEIPDFEALNSQAEQTALEYTTDLKQFYKMIGVRMQEFCSAVLLGNDILMGQLRVKQFDIAIVDGIFVNKCLYLIPYHLNLPIVTVEDRLIGPWKARIPYLPSFVPFAMLPLSDRMSFLQRVQNFMAYIASHAIQLVPGPPSEVLSKFSRYGNPVNVDEIAGRSVLRIQTCDTFLDYSKPLMPNIVEAGGIATKPARPLSQDWLQFMDASSKGVILISFSSAMSVLPKNIAVRIIKALSTIPEQVVWRFTNNDNLTIPHNVKLVDWMPQNDLLAHPNTELLITHAATNCLYEAIYHGIPVITFPVFGDGPYNSRIVTKKGFGIELNIKTFTSHDLVEAIQNILDNEKYVRRMKKVSMSYRDRPETALQQAVSAIEEVVAFGSDHLKSTAADMPLYQFLMVDTISLLFVVILVAMVITRWLLIIVMKFFLSGLLMQNTKLKSQ